MIFLKGASVGLCTEPWYGFRVTVGVLQENVAWEFFFTGRLPRRRQAAQYKFPRRGIGREGGGGGTSSGEHMVIDWEKIRTDKKAKSDFNDKIINLTDH